MGDVRKLIEAVEHDFDEHSQFCMKCGAGRLQILAGVRGECSPANVIAVSHIIAGNLMKPIMGHILRALEGGE